MIGVYKILNLVNGKFYIGSSKDIKRRFREHQRQLEKNVHHSPVLQCAWNKYGKDCFEFSILEECPLESKLEVEQRYIDELKPIYNVALSSSAPMEGRRHSEETRLKMTALLQQRPTGPGHPLYDKKWSEERKTSWSRARKEKGMKHSDETKAKMRETSIRLERWKDLADAINAHKEPIVDSLGNTFSSETEAAAFHGIKVCTLHDILSRRHYKTRAGITFYYLNRENAPFVHKVFKGEYRGVYFNRRRKRWMYSLTLVNGKSVRVGAASREDAIKEYRSLYFENYKIRLVDASTRPLDKIAN